MVLAQLRHTALLERLIGSGGTLTVDPEAIGFQVGPLEVVAAVEEIAELLAPARHVRLRPAAVARDESRGEAMCVLVGNVGRELGCDDGAHAAERGVVRSRD